VLDPKFRHALGYAVDLDRIVKSAFQGAATPGSTVVPSPYTTWHWNPPADQKFTFDLAKAGALLDAAGYEKGSDGLRTLPNGKPIGTLRLAARSDSPTSLNTMDYFKQWLSDLGIKGQVSTYSSSQLTDEIYQGNFDAFQWGWYVEPDPDSMLSYLTCGQRNGSSDSWYCNKKYDQLYAQQHTETNDTARAAEIKSMQEILYQDSPYLVTAYSSIGEAVRSDRFACLVPQPNPGGIWLEQYGVYNYVHMKPAADAATCDTATTTAGDTISGATKATTGGSSSSSTNTPLLIGAGVVLVALLVGGGVVAMRRRATAEDRE
jgi:peptide/nickel transport system substrate-binding protein